MPFFPPLKSFYKKRYLYLAAGLFTYLFQSLGTSILLKYFLIFKFGKDYLSPNDNYNDISGLMEKVEWFSMLYYPVIFFLGLVIYFLLPKAKKETRNSLLIYLLTVFVIYIYSCFFFTSVMVFILPLLMIIGFYSSFRGGYPEAQRIFALLFLALVISYSTNFLVMITFY
jgi:hypothetical protein